jgi:large subunit ribosomal protein L21
MTYAIISLGGKQYRVREGERLLVDRLPYEESETFHPAVLFFGGDGAAELGGKGVEVTARVIEHLLGEKVRIGKYRPKTGYRRRNGFRARLSRVEIQKIAQKQAQRKPAAEEKQKQAQRKPAAEEKPKPARKPAARKPAARKPAGGKPAAGKASKTTTKTTTKAET